ncbi:hypothetical protein [Janthinobacterium sp. UMAB-56]|uniref:hypothetical protein n=1 Tax=Janthinobacterium sp. UMAB-56 TaxID=1365361 RepID=UPI001C56B375|nr:hypothetical protein [Janthinobacterium sp. UMAB-56]
MSKFRKPLTTVELVEIRLRSDSRDMRAVLREIMRLRAIVSKADQLERSLGSTDEAVETIRSVLRAELDDEPSIAELLWNDLNAQ